uniref:ATP synthase CF1 subunit delta n=1 Tax=Cryptomonas sp. CCAC 1634B TaxID=2051848 RepID=A0A679C9S6_9CRYP|nr:ATP synthase CF1 subunit delta [Cryptomonas sp. CCAC 1634B]
MNVKNSLAIRSYAEAFLKLRIHDSSDSIFADLDFVLSSIRNSPVLEKLLVTSKMNSQDKKKILMAIFNANVDAKTIRFLSFVCDHNKAPQLSFILLKTLELAYKAVRIEFVTITTSSPLSISQQDDLVAKLKLMTGATQIHLKIIHDPELIGGFTINIGSKVVDTSIKGCLQQLSRYLGIQ